MSKANKKQTQITFCCLSAAAQAFIAFVETLYFFEDKETEYFQAGGLLWESTRAPLLLHQCLDPPAATSRNSL